MSTGKPESPTEPEISCPEIDAIEQSVRLCREVARSSGLSLVAAELEIVLDRLEKVREINRQLRILGRELRNEAKRIRKTAVRPVRIALEGGAENSWKRIR